MATPNSSKTKDEQLARVRRNQQRCRERKRAHVAELETQVEVLRTRLQSCEPCSGTAQTSESELERLRRENDARRDLLSALGFDESSQHRFIEHAMYRQAVRSIFTGEQDPALSIPSAPDTPQQPDQAPTLSDQPRLDADLDLDLADDTWLQSLNGFSPPFPQAPAPTLQTACESITCSPEKTAVEQCFLDTAISMQPMEVSTACSKALSWILQNNVKGYTLATLQDRLRAGIVCPAGPGQECRVKNSVLFRVLAEVSEG